MRFDVADDGVGVTGDTMVAPLWVRDTSVWLRIGLPCDAAGG